MKKFVCNIILFLLLMSPILVIRYQVMTTMSKSYWGAATASNSVIVGTSTERVGINPRVIAEALDLRIEPVNLSVNATVSPFNQEYTSFVKRKLRHAKGEGVHIVGVTPRAFDVTGRSSKLGSQKHVLYDLKMLNVHPNLEYYFRFKMTSRDLKDYWNRTMGHSTVVSTMHDNGWTENVRRTPLNKYDAFSQAVPLATEEGIRNFVDLLRFLGQRGKVIVVSLPHWVGHQTQRESGLDQFDNMIGSLVAQENVRYLDYRKEGNLYAYYDSRGVHLDGGSALAFSKRLADDIKQILAIE